MNRNARAAHQRLAFPAFLLLLLSVVPTARSVAAVSAYLPLNLSPELESRIERALTLAGVPAMTRPIRVATVQAALPAVCAQDKSLCEQVRWDLMPYQSALAVTGAGGEVAVAKDSTLLQPNQHGAPMDASLQAYINGLAHFGDHLLLSGGAVGYTGRLTPTGTMASLGGDRAQLDLGYRDHWWSPFRLGSMLISTEAPTMPSATLSNVVPLTRAHLRYEMFMAQMSYSERIAFDNGYTAGHPRLFGFHLDIEPAPGWSLGVSRLIQFGGGARAHSWSDLLRAFRSPTRYDNTSNTLTGANEFGNQQFALSSNLVLPVRLPMSLYIEYSAEDSFHAHNSRFTSSAVSAGFYLPQLRPNLQLRYEFSERQSNWYTHHIYQDGMTNYGAVLGHWDADWRIPRDPVGAQSHAVELLWNRSGGQQFAAQYRTALNASYTGGNYQRSHELGLSLSRPWRSLQVGTRIDGGRDEYGEGFGRLAAFAHFTGQRTARFPGGLDDGTVSHQTSAATDAAATAARRSVEYFVDVGMFVSQMDFEQDDGAVPTVRTSQGSVHLGLGVRRAFNRHNDFGTRVEFDNVRGHLLMALRAIDYRYRFGQHLAAGAFFGVGRYDGPTPAYGWYAGAGLQWRELLHKWDLGLDARLGDKLVRNKIPGEPIIIWPSTFYSITGASLYLSRRF